MCSPLGRQTHARVVDSSKNRQAESAVKAQERTRHKVSEFSMCPRFVRFLPLFKSELHGHRTCTGECFKSRCLHGFAGPAAGDPELAAPLQARELSRGAEDVETGAIGESNPESYFYLSIFTTLCCCPLLGLIALCFSGELLGEETPFF